LTGILLLGEYLLTCVRAGVLDNIKPQRDALFDEQQVYDKIKDTLISIMSEFKGAEAASDGKKM